MAIDDAPSKVIATKLFFIFVNLLEVYEWKPSELAPQRWYNVHRESASDSPVLGGFVFGLLGIAAVGLIGQIISATVGAVVLIFVLRLLKKA